MTDEKRRVRFNDVGASYLEQRQEIDAAINGVIARGDFIGGKAIGEFERSFAQFTCAAGCAGVANGTSALHLALLAGGVGPGDEVITSPMTFIATAEAISLCGARPVFADIDAETLNLSASAIEGAITPKTKAVIFVYLHGNPGGGREAAAVARRHGLLFFEDCAQAHGARFDGGEHVGNLGVAAGYSFFPAKNLGAFGDAGAVTGDMGLVEKVRRLANHGRSEKYFHQIEGMNARIDTLQAAVLGVKLMTLDAQVERRNLLARRYLDGLAGLPLKFQQAPEGCRHGWHLFTVHCSRRDELQAHLKDAGIETGIHYPVPLHLQPAYAWMGLTGGSFSQAESTAKCTLSLPMYPQLEPDDVDRVIDEIRKFFG